MPRILCVLRANDVHMQECKAGEGVPSLLFVIQKSLKCWLKSQVSEPPFTQ